MGIQQKKRVFEIVLLVLGSPIWLSLFVAAAAVAVSFIIAFFAVLISVIATLWAVGVSFAVTSVAGIFVAVQTFADGFAAQGFFYVGSVLLLAGLAVLTYFGSLYTTRGSVKLVKNMFFYSKHHLTKGGAEDA